MPYLVSPVVPAGRMRDLVQPVLGGPGGLVLRPWEAGDARVVLEAYQDPAIQQWNLRGFGSLEEAGAWIAQWAGRWLAERDGCWAVTDGAQTVLGRVALRGVRLMDGVADYTYWVLPAARGRGGVAVAAGRAVATLGHQGQEGVEAARVEVGAAVGRQVGQGAVGGPGRPVGAVRGQRVPDVGHGHDAGGQRDLLPRRGRRDSRAHRS